MSGAGGKRSGAGWAARDPRGLDDVLARIGRTPFRGKFHLRKAELSYLSSRGMEVVRRHAESFIADRLAAAHPVKDGKQTPWLGHPVFVAQHASATCCRSCLAKNHGIDKGQQLSAEQQSYVVDVICRWIERDAASARVEPPADQPLF